MRAFGRALAANLGAGLRLALFLKVRRLDFRFGLAPLLALFVVSALVDVGADWLRYGEDGAFSWYGLGNEILSGGILVAMSAVLALLFRERSLAMAVPVITLASFPLLQIVNALPWIAYTRSALGTFLIDYAILCWMVVVLVRAVYVALEYAAHLRPLRALAGGLILATPIYFAPWIAPVDPWFAPASASARDEAFPNPASEPVLSMQREILDDALAALDDHRPGVVDLYFVGFAGDAGGDVFRKDVEAAKRVMDEKWGTSDRSIALINNPRTLLTHPYATLSNLRDTLDEIAAAIDPDEDVVMIYLASHGARDGALTTSLPPLELVPITPAQLRAALDDAGIRNRVIVVSACYAGVYVDALADDDTVVIAAAQADRRSFGCEPTSESTYFGEAFFQDAMAKATGIAEAFEAARARVEQRERDEGQSPPSNPQARIGRAIAPRLDALKRRSGSSQQQAARRHAPGV